MKIALAILLAVVLVFVGVQTYAFFKQERQLSANLADIEAKLTKAKGDEASLTAEVGYLANPVNLEKELRARFNYKKPGETMIIIVPGKASSTSSTAPVSD